MGITVPEPTKPKATTGLSYRTRTWLREAKSAAHVWLRKVKTALHALGEIRRLTPEEIHSFMKSYIIYDCEWTEEQHMIDTLGPDYQKQVGMHLANYYRVLNHLCAVGELEKMYLPPMLDTTQGVARNQVMYEETMVRDLNLPPNARILEMGCGRGRVAAHVGQQCPDARVTGLNIDANQIAGGRAFNDKLGLSNNFVLHDFNELPLPFPDNHFDGMYQNQAFSLVKNPVATFAELLRVLKPGAKAVLLDWVSLDAFNPKDPYHRQLMSQVKPLLGALGTPTPQSFHTALEAAGFDVLRSHNVSHDGFQYPLIKTADRYYRWVRLLILWGVSLHLLPQHFKLLFDRLTKDCDAWVTADKMRLVTLSWQWIAQKPLAEKASVASVYISEKSSLESVSISEKASLVSVSISEKDSASFVVEV